MGRLRLVTEQELAEVAFLATEQAYRRCHKDPDFLRGLVRAYVGAEVAEAVVAKRCGEDPAYLESVVRDYVASLGERGLLRLLRSSGDVPAAVERLGFDPFDPARETADVLANRFFNSREQLIALVIGAVLYCLLALFPPWKVERWEPQSGGFCPQPDRKVEVRFAGHYFVLADPPEEPPTPGRSGYTLHKWYWEMLLLEWLALFIAVVVACIVLRDRRSFEERVAALESKRPGG